MKTNKKPIIAQTICPKFILYFKLAMLSLGDTMGSHKYVYLAHFLCLMLSSMQKSTKAG